MKRKESTTVLPHKNIPFLKAYNQQKLKIGFLIDRILRIFCSGRNKRPGYKEIPRKILVIQSHLIGDVMMTIPMLRALRKRYPDVTICLLANSFAKELLNNADFVDSIYTTPFPWGIRKYSAKNFWKLLAMVVRLRRERFDLAVDAQIDFRNTFLMFLIGARRRLGYDIVGGRIFLTDIPEFPREVVHLLEGRLSVIEYLNIDTSDKSYNLPLNHEAGCWVESFLYEKGIAGQDIVAIHPGASVKEKLWRSEKFAKVICYLYDRNLCPVLIEGPEDTLIVQEIYYHVKKDIIILKTSLTNVMAFFAQCRLVICFDSAASHLASAVNTSAVVLYGPQWPYLAKPFDKNVIAVWKDDLDCRPCIYTQCKKAINECMDKIQIDDVLSVVDELLSRGGIKTKRNISTQVMENL